MGSLVPVPSPSKYHQSIYDKAKLLVDAAVAAFDRGDTTVTISHGNQDVVKTVYASFKKEHWDVTAIKHWVGDQHDPESWSFNVSMPDIDTYRLRAADYSDR